MPNVEIIYISKKNSIKEPMQPRVTIHHNSETIKSDKTKNNLFKKDLNKNKEKKHKKRLIVFFICFIILIIIIAAFYNAGFLPISQFLEIKEPIGNIKEISQSSLAEKYPISKSIPELDKIKHKIYSTDEELSIISKFYIIQIQNEGYTLKYEGTENIDGFDIHYLGFIKGFTVILILMTEDNNNTIVIYSTGSVFDYKQIFEKYSNYFDF